MTRKTAACLGAAVLLLLALGVSIRRVLLDGHRDLKTTAREAWIREQSARLLVFRPTAEAVPVPVDVAASGAMVEVSAHRGYIDLGGKEWLFFTSFSPGRWPCDPGGRALITGSRSG